MGFTRAKYGGLLIKEVHEDDELNIRVVDWKNVITDHVYPEEAELKNIT